MYLQVYIGLIEWIALLFYDIIMSELFKQILAIIVISFSFVGEVHAQQGGSRGDSFPYSTLPGHEFKLEYNHKLMQDLDPDLMRLNILMKKNILPDMPLQYELLPYETWHKPIYNSLDLSGGILNSNFISYPVLGKNAFYLSGTQDLMPGIFFMNSMTAGFIIQPTDNWVINMSGSAIKYRDLIGIHNDFSIKASTYISLSDHWGINIFGGYSVNAMNNVAERVNTKSPFAPSSYFGGSLEYKFTDKFSFEAGMRREFNPWLRRWENVYYVVPKFNFGLFYEASEKQRERTDRLVKAYTNN